MAVPPIPIDPAALGGGDAEMQPTIPAGLAPKKKKAKGKSGKPNPFAKKAKGSKSSRFAKVFG